MLTRIIVIAAEQIDPPQYAVVGTEDVRRVTVHRVTLNDLPLNQERRPRGIGSNAPEEALRPETEKTPPVSGALRGLRWVLDLGKLLRLYPNNLAPTPFFKDSGDDLEG
ncbi:hypothetical protein ACE103_29470 [Bradyrhizobium sp. ma5]|uniref:hypothetical protein n=1 Tax=Bradyrhizobium sp. ma5 TaxID=3344828 RepID=UPI0035D4DD6E